MRAMSANSNTRSNTTHSIAALKSVYHRSDDVIKVENLYFLAARGMRLASQANTIPRNAAVGEFALAHEALKRIGAKRNACGVPVSDRPEPHGCEPGLQPVV